MKMASLAIRMARLATPVTLRGVRYAPRVRRLVPCLSLFALTSLVPASALAQGWGARLVRTLDRVGRADVLADSSGKIAVSAVLPAGVSAHAVGLAPFGGGTASMRMTPAQVIALGEQHPDLDLVVGPPLRPLLNIAKKWTRTDVLRKDTGLDGTGVAVGVIDTGIDILHPDFRKADGTTRIKWLLQTGAPSSGKHQALEDEYCKSHGTICAIFDEADINELLVKGLTGGTYDATGHGTHVASIAAGNGGPSVTKTVRYEGVAPGADLLIGSLESFADDDVSAAARFIFDRADAIKEQLAVDTYPCVLNVSLGSDYGAHDGSDILDRRLAALVGDDKPGRAIVVAAGNSGGLYQFEGEDAPWGIHTEATVYPTADVRVPMYAPESKAGRAFVWVTFQPGDDVSIGLEGPGGTTWVDQVAPGHEDSYEDEPNTAGIVNNLFKPGASFVPVTNGAVVVFAGAWAEHSEFAIRLSGRGHAQLWVTSTGDLSQSVGMLFKRAIRQGTINVPASSPSLLAVGCTLNRLTWPTVNGLGKAIELPEFGGDLEPELDSVCYFSSAGPTPGGLPKPEIVAPGAFVAAAMASTADPRKIAGSLFDQPGCPEGVPNCYLADERHAIAAGTSMSSPHVAGAIALLFQKEMALAETLARPFSLTQAKVTAVLQAGAQYPEGKVHNEVQLGPGELDMIGAVRALEDESGQSQEPDVAKSWYVLSSGYARPDAAWPVWGTVELRLPDGETPLALDGTFLTLDVQNGVVLQPLRKIRNGLFRFSVAGELGSSGRELVVDVRYKDRSLGVKSLPIGNDVWTQHEPLDAVGSCALAAAPTPTSPARAPIAWALATLAALTIERRRRRTRDDDAR